MNRLQDCFDDDDAGNDVSAGPLFQGKQRDPSAPLIEGIDYIYNPQAREAGGPFKYDAYGQKPQGEPAGDMNAGPLFQGMRHDPAKPLCEDRPRDMHPGIARWMDQEPSGYVEGLNWYNAPVDEPVNRVDPLGMDT